MKPGYGLLANPIEWGRQLILTHDHDPLYVGLTQWDVKGPRLRRFLLSYWCCYSIGASWYISRQSGSRFWALMRSAAQNAEPSPLGGRWPRGAERRHWRGQKCVDCVDWLRERFKHPEEAVLSLEGARSLNEVIRLVGAWPQYGPWITWKVADMLERVIGAQIAFPLEVIMMYKDPREGAELVASIMGNGDNPQQAVAIMLDAYSGTSAPGLGGRACNIQEVETVLCKYKSAAKGHYWIGLDTRNHRAELAQWGANDLLAAYPTLLA